MHFETAPAKINLTLDALYKRDDGYHEVSMVMTTIDLNDYLSFERRKDKNIVIVSEHQFVPNDSRNFAYQAAELMMATYNIKTGVTITLDKNIPIAAGLAGGSSDAAATFRGLNELYELNVPLDELAELSSQIGSDVPFCVYGGTALATGRGEKIKRLPKLPNAWVVVAKPQVGVSTKTIYDALTPGKYTPKSDRMVSAIQNEDYKSIINMMKNDLQEVTIAQYDVVEKLITTLNENGADKAMMSGSGPTVFALVQKERQAIQLYNAIKGCCSEVYKVRTLG